MKRISLIAALLAAVCLLSGCTQELPEAQTQPQEAVELRIVTSYGDDDGNRGSFAAAVDAYEQATGNTVRDDSNVSSENWKARVMADFETGSEPDVLFYFTDADSRPLIQAGKVVPLSEIRQVYPDYASNMDPNKLPMAEDGECYAVPITGYWEYLFVNKAVLRQCGVEVPAAGYTWEQFLQDCETIRDAGFVPIACSLAEVSHYWFEYALLNNGTADTHGEIPRVDEAGALVEDDAARKWIAGLEDIRSLYQQGFFPENTLSAGDTETFSLFGTDQAAFLLEGSWKVGLISGKYADKVENFGVCPVPWKNGRPSDVAIGGISSGFFITRKAWEDPEKREAAVEFVTHLTSDEVVKTFVTTEITALREPVPPVALNPLQQSAAETMGITSRWVRAVQDSINSEARGRLFSNIQNVVSGEMTARDAVEAAARLNGAGSKAR